MATSYTYTSLTDELTAWMEGGTSSAFSDFTGRVDDLIAKAELRCLRDLALEIFDETDTSKSTSIGSATLALADDAIMLRSLYVDGALVEPRAESYVNYYAGLVANGQPLYWCQSDETSILLAPVPDAIYTTRQRVMKRPAGLSDTTPTTWLSTNAGDLLFLAAKAEAERLDRALEDAGAEEQKYLAMLPTAKVEIAMLQRRDYG